MELQCQRTAVTTIVPSTVRVDNFRVVDAARMVPKFDPPADLENYLLSFERICTVNA